MFKPSFKIGSFAPPQPSSTTGVALSTETPAPTPVVTANSGAPAVLSSLSPQNEVKTPAALLSSANEDDEIAEEVEYDEVSTGTPLILS